jgi:hypothetical protein
MQDAVNGGADAESSTGGVIVAPWRREVVERHSGEGVEQTESRGRVK